MLTKVCEVHRY